MATKTNIGMILPHKFQKVGWWTLIATIFLLIAVIFLDGVHTETSVKFGIGTYNLFETLLTVSLPILANITIFLLCLSDEKEEDEYVMHVRMGIIKKLACFWFILSLLESLLIFFSSRFFTLESTSIISLIFRPFTNIYILSIIYIYWLKIKLHSIRKEAARD